jgi:pyruvate dehydrogenase E2 component (dihydrolipoamide acetyltransferase)
MSESVNLPALGESVTEGTVTRWLKNVGDRVEVDEPLLEVSTDKVDTEIPSPVAGVIEEILVPEDETVEVGTALVRIGDGSADAPAEPASDEQADETETATPRKTPTTTTPRRPSCPRPPRPPPMRTPRRRPPRPHRPWTRPRLQPRLHLRRPPPRSPRRLRRLPQHLRPQHLPRQRQRLRPPPPPGPRPVTPVRRPAT